MRTGDVGSRRASQRGSRTEALADPSMKGGGRGNARAAGWALERDRGPTDAIKVSGENGRELTWQVNPWWQVTTQSRTGLWLERGIHRP